MKLFLSYDPITKIRRDFYADADGNEFVIDNRQDVTEIIEDNKALAAAVDERAGFKGEHFHRVASIPLTVYMDLERRGITRDEKAFRKWLNDRDNLAFRVRPGRV